MENNVLGLILLAILFVSVWFSMAIYFARKELKKTKKITPSIIDIQKTIDDCVLCQTLIPKNMCCDEHSLLLNDYNISELKKIIKEPK